MSPQTAAAAANRRSDVSRSAPIGRVSHRHRQPHRVAQSRPSADQRRGQKLARFLGFFSLGLGLAELLAPRQMAAVIGIEDDERNRKLLRAMGAREMLNGVAVLASHDPEKAMWARVSGDAMDLACLGEAFANPRNDRKKTAFATANVLAVTAADVLCATRLSSREARA
jgi:hypothetical protein